MELFSVAMFPEFMSQGVSDLQRSFPRSLPILVLLGVEANRGGQKTVGHVDYLLSHIYRARFPKIRNL